MDHAVEHTSVLIVGGGLVGLTAALLLQQHGTPTILVEREQANSPLPRARGWAVRSMEIWRSLGLQEKVEAAAKQAWEQGLFGGARKGTSMLFSEELEIPDTKVMTGADASPCKMVACPQTLVEPLLRRELEERGGDVRFGCELLSFSQDDGHVRAVVKGENGAERTIEAKYLLAADGSRGFIRKQLNIDRHGSTKARHYLNVYFESDLAERVKGKTFSQCEIENETVTGVFLSMNNTTLWSFHLLFNPEMDNPETWSEDHLTALLHAAIGETVALKVLHRGPWVAVDRVAESYIHGRVFLVGDTAHIMPPWGGLNGNTGIADAHNLAWKLARVDRGEASMELLQSYDAERRPVANRNVGQAQLRSDFTLRFGIRTPENATNFGKLRDGGELLMRYRYGANDTVDSLKAERGTRFPHAWIEKDGQKQSILDLFKNETTTLGGPEAEARLCLRAGHDFHFLDDGITWQTLTACPDNGTVNIRPDGFVTP